MVWVWEVCRWSSLFPWTATRILGPNSSHTSLLSLKFAYTPSMCSASKTIVSTFYVMGAMLDSGEISVKRRSVVSFPFCLNFMACLLRPSSNAGPQETFPCPSDSVTLHLWQYSPLPVLLFWHPSPCIAVGGSCVCLFLSSTEWDLPLEVSWLILQCYPIFSSRLLCQWLQCLLTPVE